MGISTKLMRRSLVVAFVVCYFGAFAIAQSTTDGAIGGTVYDSTGAVVGGATIVCHNNGTNAEQSVTADGSGNYRIASLQPGTYTVTVKGGSGFGTYKAEQVIVQVGSVTEVSPRLKTGGTSETVDVTAEAPQINVTTPDFANTINDTSISNLPINGGRWSNFALLTPTVVSNGSGFGLLSFRGISALLNNNTVDGADNNQAFFSEERGRTRIGYSTPKAAIGEFQVNTSNYSSEYGRSAGGVINTVTKSGTNNIHGETYFYDRDNTWGAANAFTVVQVPNGTGGFSPVNFKPTNWRKMAGFGVGGPLIKDRLFGFLAYDWYHQNFPGTGVANNPGVFFAPPTATQITTLSTRLGITAAAATTLYNNDLAALSTTLGPVPRTGLQNILYPKLDWIINPKNNASFSFNRMRWSSPAGIQTQATNSLGIASFGNDYVKNTWGVAKLDTLITSNLANQVRFQYGRDFEFEFAQPPTSFEAKNIVTQPGPFATLPSYTNPLGLPPNISLTNGQGSGFSIGVPTFLQRAAFPDETRMQIADTMTWTHGKHSVKWGMDFSHVNDNAQNLRTQFGSYSYSGVKTLVDLFSDLSKQNTCAGKPCYTNYSQSFGPLGFEFTSNDYAFFVQDDWKILPRITLSLGMRYEYEQMPKTFANLVNPSVPQTTQLPRDQNNFGPRIGFAWDFTGSGRTVLRGGYGIYYGRVINSTIYNALINTGMPGGQFNFFFPSATTAGAPVFPQILAAQPGPTVKGNITFFDKHFQNPQIHQMDMTLEHNVGWNTVVSVSYLGSLGRQLPGFADVNICPGAGPAPAQAGASGFICPALGSVTLNVAPGGPITSATITEPVFNTRPNPGFNSMTDVFSGINSRYDAFVVQVQHRFSHHVQFSANYTRSRSIDFNQNESTFSDTNDLLVPFNIAADKGPSIYDVPWRFVVHSVMTSPWKKTGALGWFTNDWEFDPIYQVQAGLPYSARTSGSLPNALTPIGSGINGSGGDNRIDVVGRNTFRFPNAWISDIRLAKYFTFTEKYKLELMADFFNLANKQNVTALGTGAYSISGTTLTFNSATFGVATNSNSNFQYTPRQVQLGARFRF